MPDQNPEVQSEIGDVPSSLPTEPVTEPKPTSAAKKLPVKKAVPKPRAKARPSKVNSKGNRTPLKERATRSEAVKLSLQVKYPRHSISKALRFPKVILEQNAGKACSDVEAAGFLGNKLNGEIRSGISSAIKYGLLERVSSGRIKISELAKKILR